MVRCCTVTRLTRHVHSVTPDDVTADHFSREHESVRVRRSHVLRLDAKNKTLFLDDGSTVTYRHSVCLCAGARAHVLQFECDACAAAGGGADDAAAAAAAAAEEEEGAMREGGDSEDRCRQSCVLGIRDTQSVQYFVERLARARRVVIVGNGGIASELAYSLHGVQVVWVIRDSSIASTFVDAGCAQFLLADVLSNTRLDGATDGGDGGVVKRWKYTVNCLSEAGVTSQSQSTPASGHIQSNSITGASVYDCDETSSIPANNRSLCAAAATATATAAATATTTASAAGVARPVPGSALGPDWRHQLPNSGVAVGGGAAGDVARAVSLQLNTQVARLLLNRVADWPVTVELTNGRLVDCDFVVSATGVSPNVQPFLSGNKFKLAADGGIVVDECMMTSEPSVFAAGDICTPGWELSPHWFQMRLWSQARQMGEFAAMCMTSQMLCAPPPLLDISFEMFAHVTQLFGRKLILLGLFNGQRLAKQYTAMVRVTPGEEYIKVVVKDGRVQGALLLGDTDLEETFENLILSQLDVSHLGDDLLSPDFDLEDYFD